VQKIKNKLTNNFSSTKQSPKLNNKAVLKTEPIISKTANFIASLEERQSLCMKGEQVEL